MTNTVETSTFKLELLCPEAEYDQIVTSMAPQLESLTGKRIGLFWNGKPGGDILLNTIGKELQERFNVQLIKFNLYVGCGQENVRRMAEECDGVVSAIADCGSCTMWCIRDSAGIEMLGKPTVAIVSDWFEVAARTEAKMAGVTDLPIVIVPHPVAGLAVEILEERAGIILGEIIDALTLPVEKIETHKIKVKPEREVISLCGETVSQAIKMANDFFYDNKWTDGFPIIPPTPEALEWMLSGTRRSSDEVIGLVPPVYGRATVKNIAINAVMAGAQPDFLPVIITAVEVISDPLFATAEQKTWGASGMQTTTGPLGPLLIVNGPIAKKIGIESGQGCLAPGHRANATIGRALKLILINTGRSRIGINDMKGHGSPHQFTFTIAEAEDDPVFHSAPKPWQTLHVELGFPPEISTVTAFAAFPPVNVEEGRHYGPEILHAMADTMTNLGQLPHEMNWPYVFILNPTHAQGIAEAGWAKNDIAEFLWANSVMPWRKFKQYYPGPSNQMPAWMSRIASDDTTVHIIDSPKNIHVIVAGGACIYSQMVRCSFRGLTKEIKG
jgi:hypothetical protein